MYVVNGIYCVAAINAQGIDMARKTKEEAQETYDRILAAAARIFYKKGYNNATLKNIADEAGLTRGAIYWHFQNKRDIFSAYHEQMHSTFMSQIIASNADKNSNPLEKLKNLCISILTDFKNNQERRRAMEIFLFKCDYSGDMAPFLAEQGARKDESRNVTIEFFKEAQKKNLLAPDLDCRLLAHGLFCYMSGLMTEDLHHPNHIDLATSAPRLITLFFDGLKAPP